MHTVGLSSVALSSLPHFGDTVQWRSGLCCRTGLKKFYGCFGSPCPWNPLKRIKFELTTATVYECLILQNKAFGLSIASRPALVVHR